MKISYIAILLLAVFFSIGCSRTEFEYPESKIWAHRVNDTPTLKNKEHKFDGFEVDVVYSDFQDKLFVAHDSADTANNLQLCEWFDALENPAEKYFWIDAKNLQNDNAGDISKAISNIKNKHNIGDRIFVESQSISALRKMRRNGFRIILWLNNLKWNNIDTATWISQTQSQIEELNPDAISNESGMFELMTEKFPNQNIHIWQTPAKYNEKNVQRTKQMAEKEAVKIILVDYDSAVYCKGNK